MVEHSELAYISFITSLATSVNSFKMLSLLSLCDSWDGLHPAWHTELDEWLRVWMDEFMEINFYFDHEKKSWKVWETM